MPIRWYEVRLNGERGSRRMDLCSKDIASSASTDSQLEETKEPRRPMRIRIQFDQMLKNGDCLCPMSLRSQKISPNRYDAFAARLDLHCAGD